MKIRVLKGYLAHEGEMYGKGEVVDIKKKAIALSLLSDEPEEEMELPEVDAEVTVKK